MSQLFVGKLVLITGAGSGIGRATCQVLAREGAKVVATDQDIETAKETVKALEGTDHVALHMQVADWKSVEAAFKDITKKFLKPPTIIVNCAGIFRPNNLISFNDEDFDQLFNVNLKGTLLVMQTAVKAMIEADATRGSSIINISSIAGKQPLITHNIYSATKAAVISISKLLARNLENWGFELTPYCLVS